MESWDWIEIWQRSRQSWHWPLLPPPVLREEGISSSFVFPNYQITLNQQDLELGPLYLENLFDHLIVQYIFCPRSLENAGLLAMAALKGLGHHLPSDSAYAQAYSSAYSLAYTPTGKMSLDRAAHILSARRMVNIFSDIVSDSFRLERSGRDEELVLMGYRRLADRDGQAGCPLMPMDRVILGFLRAFWGADLPPAPSRRSSISCGSSLPASGTEASGPGSARRWLASWEPSNRAFWGRGRSGRRRY